MGGPVDPAQYYNFCSGVKEPDKQGYCRQYVDQCVAHLNEIGDRDASSYALVSESGEKQFGLDFDRCVSLAPVFSLNGPAKQGKTELPAKADVRKPPDDKPKVDEGAADPGKKPDGDGEKPDTRKEVAIYGCKAEDYGTEAGGKPGWLTADIPGHGMSCFNPKKVDDPEEQIYFHKQLAGIPATVDLIQHYCGADVQGQKTLDPSRRTTEYRSHTEGVTMIPTPYAKEYIERRSPDMTCVHVFMEWGMITCKGGKAYICK